MSSGFGICGHLNMNRINPFRLKGNFVTVFLMRIEILFIGDELLLGLRLNAHQQTLGALFASRGGMVSRGHCLTDEPEEIADIFSGAWGRSDLVITTGGLGPTSDDLTRETIAECLGAPLQENAAVIQAIEERFRQIGRPMTPNNRRQAMVPAGAEVMDNPNGTAPGIWLEKDGKVLAMLPGPPRELIPMVENQLLPRLEKKGWLYARSRMVELKTAGVGESSLATKVEEVLQDFPEVRPAYCAHEGVVDLRLTPKNPDLPFDHVQIAASRCAEAIGEDFVGFGKPGLAERLIQELRQRERTLATAESCTGGLLADGFTDIPGASKVLLGGVVSYTNEAKQELLEVPESILEQHGAVSQETAIAMATGIAEKLGSDYALSVTGFAGPSGGDGHHPVGTIFLGLYTPEGVWASRMNFPGTRQGIKCRAVNAAMDWLRRHLASN